MEAPLTVSEPTPSEIISPPSVAAHDAAAYTASEGNGGRTMDLSARLIEDQTFATSRKGYDRSEVDAFVAAAAAYCSRLEEERSIAMARAERSQRELDRMNDMLETRIEEARDARANLLEEAKREADRIIANAERAAAAGDDATASSRAAAIISEAETKAELRMNEVEAIREQARQEALSIERDAKQAADLKRAEAERVLDAARRDARDMRRASEADRSRLERQLRQVERLLADASDGRNLSDTSVSIDDDGDMVVDLRLPDRRPTDAGT